MKLLYNIFPFVRSIKADQLPQNHNLSSQKQDVVRSFFEQLVGIDISTMTRNKALQGLQFVRNPRTLLSTIVRASQALTSSVETNICLLSQKISSSRSFSYHRTEEALWFRAHVDDRESDDDGNRCLIEVIEFDERVLGGLSKENVNICHFT